MAIASELELVERAKAGKSRSQVWSAGRAASSSRFSGKRLSRAERTRRAREREDAHAKRTLERWRERVRSRGGDGVDVAVIPRHVWETSWAIRIDGTGAAARSALRTLPNTAAKTALLRAAFGIGARGARYRWSDARARCITALAVSMLLLARKTRRRGAWGGGEVLGIPRGAFCQLLRDVNDPRGGVPSVTALFGTHRPGATAESGEVGYFVALKEAGFAYRRQLPKAKAHPCEATWGAYTTNRYQICASAPERCSERFQAAIMERIGLLLAVQEGPRALELELGRLTPRAAAPP